MNKVLSSDIYINDYKSNNRNLINKMLAEGTIYDTFNIVKEIIDNSIDSGANNIIIKLVNYSTELILIIDNGKGIPNNTLLINNKNIDNICSRGFTNKIKSHDDINYINTIGFRGQALCAISEISDLYIISKSDNDVCPVFSYWSKGSIIFSNYINKIEEKFIPEIYKLNENIYNDILKVNNCGTFVICNKIYINHIVRRKAILNNKLKILKQINKYVYATSIINFNLAIDYSHTIIDCNNKLIKEDNMYIDKGIMHNECIERNAKLLENEDDELANILYRCSLLFNRFKPKLISKTLNDNKWELENIIDFKLLIDNVYIKGFVNKYIDSGSYKITNKLIKNNKLNSNESNELCYYFVNNKYVNKIDEIDKVILNYFRKYNKLSNPVRIVIIDIPKGQYNFNTKETKDKVNFKNKDLIINKFQKEFEEYMYKFSNEEIIYKNNCKKLLEENISIDNNEINNNFKNEYTEYSQDKQSYNVKKDTDYNLNYNDFNTDSFNDNKINDIDYGAKSQNNHKNISKCLKNTNSLYSTDNNNLLDNSHLNNTKVIYPIDDPNNDTPKYNTYNQINKYLCKTMINNISTSKSILLKENYSFINKIFNKDAKSMQLQVSDINKNFNIKIKFKKSDFINLEIIGQFNKSFLILKKSNNIFAVDQHAADERNNYEIILNNYKIIKQQLILPVTINNMSRIELPHLLYINENLELLNKLGYSISKSLSNTKNIDIFLLTSVPNIYKYVGTIDDFLNLIYYLIDNNIENNDNIKKNINLLPDKCLESMTYTACRSSIMIGDSLDKYTIKKILINLSNLTNPWVCAHGRPSIILININTL